MSADEIFPAGLEDFWRWLRANARDAHRAGRGIVVLEGFKLHGSNLPAIGRLGGLFSTLKLAEMGETFCAGGDEDSLSLDRQCGMDKFVHLCFTDGHPMAFRLKERKPDANLIYLRIDRAILYQPGVMFATGVGYANYAETVTLAEAVERNLIDYQALYTWTDWNDPEAQRKRRAAELCEILIPDFVPPAFIRNLPNG